MAVGRELQTGRSETDAVCFFPLSVVQNIYSF